MGTMETSTPPLHDSLKDILHEPDVDQLSMKLYISALSGHVGPKLQQRILGKSRPKNLEGTRSVEKVGRELTGEMNKSAVKDDVEKLDNAWPNKTSTYVDMHIENLVKQEEESSTCKSIKASSKKKDKDFLNVDLFSKRTQKYVSTPSLEIKMEADDEVMVQNERKMSNNAFTQTLIKKSAMSSKRKRKIDEDDLTGTDEGGDENEEEEEEQSEIDDKDTEYKPGK